MAFGSARLTNLTTDPLFVVFSQYSSSNFSKCYIFIYLNELFSYTIIVINIPPTYFIAGLVPLYPISLKRVLCWVGGRREVGRQRPVHRPSASHPLRRAGGLRLSASGLQVGVVFPPHVILLGSFMIFC